MNPVEAADSDPVKAAYFEGYNAPKWSPDGFISAAEAWITSETRKKQLEYAKRKTKTKEALLR